jgi:hypothetical protein
MKERFIIALLIGAALTIGAFLSLRHTPQTRTQGLPSDNPTEAERPQQPQDGNAQEKRESWVLEPVPAGSNLQESLQELARRRGVPLNVLTQQSVTQVSNLFQEMARQVNRSIEFYGKAVDENGLPVNGISVQFDGIAFPEIHFSTNVLSDAKGVFKLAGVTGEALRVHVSNGAYYEVTGANQNNFDYTSPKGFNPDSNNPVIFHLRKKEL